MVSLRTRPPVKMQAKPKPRTDAKGGPVPTPHQAIAGHALYCFLSGSEERMFLLTGYSGTGKTTVLSATMQEYLAKDAMCRMAFTAISNKAVKVLKKMAEARGIRDRIEPMTVCKLLGLKPKINNVTGEQEFLPDPKTPPCLNDFDVVVIDEISMVGAKLWALLLHALDLQDMFHKTKIICVGDIAQLKPVKGSEVSPAFTQIPEHCRAHLTEVMRYDGSLGVLAEEVRTTPGWVTRPVINTAHNTDRTKGVWLLGTADFDGYIKAAFNSEKYKRNTDSACILAYRNATVKKMNAYVHASIYGDGADRFQVGATIVANSPVNNGRGDPIMANSDEAVIEGVRTGSDGNWKVHILDVQIEGQASPKVIYVLHESEQARYNEQLKQFAKAKNWKQFWDLKNRFADIAYTFSRTIHKSQGSTYDDVFFVLPDMYACQDEQEREQLAYVAITRAANRLFVSNGR